MIILFQNLLTGLIFYFLGNPLVVNLLPVLLDEQGTVRALLSIQMPTSFQCVHCPLCPRSSKISQAGMEKQLSFS